jgi:stage V sporulation protein AB
MTSAVLEALVVAFLGLAGGVAVGSGMVAFLMVLDVIPRLTQLTRSYMYIQWYEIAVVAGSLFFTFADFYSWRVSLFPLGTAVIGLFMGCFIGLLAAALTEVVNVIPILAKRVGIGSYITWLLWAMMLGKVFGSLFEWIMDMKE